MSFLYLLVAMFIVPTTPVALMPNSVTICNEGCTITAISTSTAVLQFGVGSTWGQTFTSPKLPLLISYTVPNNILSSFDPAPGIIKGLNAQEQSESYTVTYSLNGKSVTVAVPALKPVSPPAPTPISTFPATCTVFSDNTFSCTATGSVTSVVNP